MPDSDMLEVIDDADNVLGTERRDVIHAQGLRHREVHVWLVTPQSEIIFQHRAVDKDTFPNLLDASCCGHVEVGDSYCVAALRETEEETGLKLDADDLVLVRLQRHSATDEVTATTNCVIRALYTHLYTGDVADLKVEPGKAEGFVVVPASQLASPSDELAARLIPNLMEAEWVEFLTSLPAVLGLDETAAQV